MLVNGIVDYSILVNGTVHHSRRLLHMKQLHPETVIGEGRGRMAKGESRKQTTSPLPAMPVMTQSSPATQPQQTNLEAGPTLNTQSTQGLGCLGLELRVYGACVCTWPSRLEYPSLSRFLRWYTRNPN